MILKEKTLFETKCYFHLLIMDRSYVIQKHGLIANDLIINPDISRFLSIEEEGALMARYFKVGREKFELDGDELFTFFEENWNIYHERLLMNQKYKTLHEDIQHLVEMIPKRKMIVDKQKDIIKMDITLTAMINNDTEKQRCQLSDCFIILERLIQEMLELKQIEHDLEKKKLEKKRILKEINDAEDKAHEVMQKYINIEINKQLQNYTTTDKLDLDEEKDNNVAKGECETRLSKIGNIRDISESKHNTNLDVKQSPIKQFLATEIDGRYTNELQEQNTLLEIDSQCKISTQSIELDNNLLKPTTVCISTEQAENDTNFLLEKTENYKSTMYIQVSTDQGYRKKQSETGHLETLERVPSDRSDKRMLISQTNHSKYKYRTASTLKTPKQLPNVIHASVSSKYMGKCSSKEWIVLPKSRFNCLGNRNKWKEECMKRNWRDKTNENCKNCLSTLWSDMCRSYGQCLKCLASRE